MTQYIRALLWTLPPLTSKSRGHASCHTDEYVTLHILQHLNHDDTIHDTMLLNMDEI